MSQWTMLMFLLPGGRLNYDYEGLIMTKLTANFEEIMSTSPGTFKNGQ